MLLETPTDEIVVDSFRCGASAVLSRTQPVNDVLKCIDQVSKGEVWVSKTDLDHLLSALRSTPGSGVVGCEDIRVLSARELEVVKHAAEGRSNKEIATRMALSEHTVKNYLFRAFEKIGVSNRVELLFYLLQQGQSPSNRADDRPVNPQDLLRTHEKVAERGLGMASVQFMIGLAHHEGAGTAKDDGAAYQWLRMAEQNAEHILHQSRSILEKLRKKLTVEETREIEAKLGEVGYRKLDVERVTELLHPTTTDKIAV
jgi:DNA-binding CsgD family transcriptional regulator